MRAEQENKLYMIHDEMNIMVRTCEKKLIKTKIINTKNTCIINYEYYEVLATSMIL